MKFSAFKMLLFLFIAHQNVERGAAGFISRIFNPFGTQSEPADEKGDPSLVLAIQESNCIVANLPVYINRKDPDFGKYLFACPAETDEQRTINDEKSLTKNSLFITKSYGNIKLEGHKIKPKSEEDKKKPDAANDDPKDYELIEYDCGTPVKPSVVYQGTKNVDGIVIDIYLVGFELYIKEEYQKLEVVKYGKYITLKQNFEWFNVITIHIDREHGNVLRVNSGVFNSQSTVFAQKFARQRNQNRIRSNHLGQDTFFEKLRIDHIYSLERQEMVFNKLFKNPAQKNAYFHKEQNRYLVETYLASLDGFVSPLLEQAAMTYGNIAPMWKTIKENSWSTVENHITYLVQGLFGVYTVTGTYGTLTISGKEIHLGPGRKVRVPLAFWKIVTYPRSATEHYNMLIVTMNNPYEDATHDLCAKSQCTDNGWNYIQQDSHCQGRTFCCELTEDIINKLQMDGFISVGRVLNLKAVPHMEDEKLTLNLTQFIEDRKTDVEFDPSIRADDKKYRNPEDYVLQSEKKEDKKDDGDDEFSLSKFALSLFMDYAVPGASSMVTKAKNYVGSKMSPRGGQITDDDTAEPLLSNQNTDAEMNDATNDQKHGDEVEKSALDDQKDSVEDRKSRNDGVKLRKRVSSKNEDEPPAKDVKLEIP